MEPSNDEDFQPSKRKSRLYSKGRHMLSTKHQTRTQHEKQRKGMSKYDPHYLYSPVSFSFKSKTMKLEEDPFSLALGCEQDEIQKSPGSACEENCKKLELDNLMESSVCKSTVSFEQNTLRTNDEQNTNAVMSVNPEPSETSKKLNDNELLLNNGTAEITQMSLNQRNTTLRSKEHLSESGNHCVNTKECVNDHVETSNVRSGNSDNVNNDSENLSSSETDNVLDNILTVHSDSNDSNNCKSDIKTKKSFHCPLCLKTFEKIETHILHMKGCAMKHNVTTKKLLDAVELHEKQAAEREALGLPSIPTAPAVKKSTSRKSVRGGYDENLQLALALSASMKEEEDNKQLQEDECLIEAGLGQEVVQQQKTLLEKYGFTSSRPAILTRNKSRSILVSKKKCGTPILLSRTKEERERQITEKVAIILMGDKSKSHPPTTDAPQDIQPAEHFVQTTKNLERYQDKLRALWNKVSLRNSEKECRTYYVKTLSNFISPSKVKAGAKLKRLSQIPGRSNTPERIHTQNSAEYLCSNLPESTSVRKKTEKNLLEPKSRRNLAGSLTDNHAGKNNLAETLINDWKSVFNRKAMSDLTVYVEEDKKIPAHKLVLYARCRAILQDIVSEVSIDTGKKTTDMLLWVDVSFRAALAFLQFLYCGLTSKILHLEEEDLLNVKRLCQRYRVTELLQYLKVVNNVRSRVNKSQELSPFKQTAESHDMCFTQKKVFVEDTSCAKNMSPELNEKSEHSISPEIEQQNDQEFSESAVSGQYSVGSMSPDMFVGDPEEDCVDRDLKNMLQDDVKRSLSQESRKSMDYLLSMIDKPSPTQNNTQCNAASVSFERPSSVSPHGNSIPEARTEDGCLSISGKKSELFKPVTESNDFQNKSLSEIQCTSNIKDLTSLKHDDITSEFVSFKLSTKDHKFSLETGSLENKMDRNLRNNNYENLQHIFQSTACTDTVEQEMTPEAESAFDEIDFLEYLLSDSPIKTNSKESLMKSKRKHSGSNSSTDHSSSIKKKTCRPSEDNETSNNITNQKGKSDKFKIIEDEVIETLDLIQSSGDSQISESTQVENTVSDKSDIEIEVTTNNARVDTESYICNDLFKKMVDNSDTDKKSKYEHFDEDSGTEIERNGLSVEKSVVSQEGKNTVRLDNVQDRDEWDEFDEMCRASVPKIFSQCLTQLISTKSTSEKCLKTRNPPSKHGISRKSNGRSSNLSSFQPNYSLYNSCEDKSFKKTFKNKSEPASVICVQRSPNGKGVLEDSIIDHLNESVFWRDDNAPIIKESSEETTVTIHRTPNQKPKDSKKVTPLADYSAMKTPQIKKELGKYGLKPSLTKKQAKRMLRYIYDQLHPYIAVSDSSDAKETSDTEPSTSFKKPDINIPVPRSPVKKANISGSPVKRNIMRSKSNSQRHNSLTARNVRSSQSETSSDCDELSQESSSSSALGIEEEALFGNLEIFSQGDGPLSQEGCSSVDLRTAIYNFITTNPQLYQKMLMYEPIWIEELLDELKANNIKCKMDQLMDYLDEQCITFRSAQGQRNRQKKKLKQEAKRQKFSKQRKKKKKENPVSNRSTSSSTMNTSHSDN